MKRITTPGRLLRLEAFVVFASAILLYAHFDGDSTRFLLLFLVFDLSMIGYLVNPGWGSITYNAIHSYPLPALLIAYSLNADWNPGIHFSLIWIAHIGFDRTLGFGLKYAVRFKDTHLNRI